MNGVSGALGEQALAALQRRLRLGLALPERGLDPTLLDPVDLARYALISRPAAPLGRLLEAWHRLYAGVAVIAPPRFALAPTLAWQPGPLGQHSGRSPQARAGLTRWGTSRNWSGAVLLAHDAERFRRIGARWVVPMPALPQGASEAQPPAAGAWQSSTWVGLDGYRAFSRSLPQIGTVSEMTPQGPRSYAWVQWWVRGEKVPPVPFANLEVRPGDGIDAALEVAEGGAAASFSITCRPPKGDPRLAENRTFVLAAPDLASAPVRAEGRSAAFCTLERPLTFTDPPLLYPLPALGPVRFVGAAAGVRARDGSERERDLTAARMLRMVGRGEGREGVDRLAGPRAPAREGRAPLLAQSRG